MSELPLPSRWGRAVTVWHSLLAKKYIIAKVDLAYIYKDVNPIYDRLATDSDGEKFQAAFYSVVVRYGAKYVKNVPSPVANLVMKKFSDKLFHHFSQNVGSPASVISDVIPNDEKEGLQYLSGYVVRKLLKTSEQKKIYEWATILRGMIANNDDGQPLIQSKNRGGLVALTENAQKLFEKAEIMHKSKLQSSIENRHIDNKSMVALLMKDVNIISRYHSFVGDNVDKEVKDMLLEKLMALYLRVRAFSSVKDIASKYMSENKKGKSKALRAELKKKEDGKDGKNI